MPLDTHARADLPVRIRVPNRPLGPFEAYRKMQRNILELIPEAAYHEPIISGGKWRKWHMVMDPALLERVLKTREDIYPRSDVTKRIVRPTKGENVFTAYGDTWKRQHKAMAPAFQHRNILGLTPTMSACADESSRRISDGAGAPIDIYSEMITVTCDIICDTAMSGRDQLDRGAFAAIVAKYLAQIAKISMLDLIGAPEWLPRPVRLFDRLGPKMDILLDTVLENRIERGPNSPPDMLDMLIGSEDPKTGENLSQLELRNNLQAFIIAGHETTAITLTWALYLLAFDQDCQEKARKIALSNLDGRTAEADDLPKLGYIRQILDEAMRMYPPAALMTRTATARDDLGGTKIRGGDTIILPIYALHRHRALWDEPDQFKPDRFAPGMAKTRNRFGYLPFGAGPRICIGMAFAMTEMTIVLATLISRYEFSLSEGFEPRPEMLLTLRPANGMLLRARPI